MWERAELLQWSVATVLAGHEAKIITASLLSLFQPVLAGHLSITASLLSPKVV